jgi:uncharacterized protein YndB with AHSA1/START domain
MSEAKTEEPPADEAPTYAPADRAVVIECDLDAPPAKVWRAISEPDIRTEWLGEAEAGPSEVRRADPPERLDLAWPTRDGESLISFEVNPSGDGGSHLTITHHAPPMACVVPLKRRGHSAEFEGSGQWRMAA